jgi:hypothetical protein
VGIVFDTKLTWWLYVEFILGLPRSKKCDIFLSLEGIYLKEINKRRRKTSQYCKQQRKHGRKDCEIFAKQKFILNL